MAGVAENLNPLTANDALPNYPRTDKAVDASQRVNVHVALKQKQTGD